MYPPQDAITHIQNALRDVERLSGTTNRNVQRSYMKQYKDQMIKEKLVVGNVAAVEATLPKLAIDANARLEAKEKSWLYLAYCCFKDAVILELVNNTTSGSTTATDLVDDDTAPNVAVLPIESRHTIVDAMSLSAPRQLLVHTISNTLLLEAKECLLGGAVEPNITTSKMQLRINTLVEIIPSKLQAFKSHGIPASRDLQYHWVFSVFTDNIHSLCQLAGAFNQISNSIESAGVLECLLKPPSVGHYAKVVISDDEGYATLQGASLWHDDQRARFRISSCVHARRLKVYTKTPWPSPKAHRVNSQGSILSTSQVFPSREAGIVCSITCQCMLV